MSRGIFGSELIDLFSPVHLGPYSQNDVKIIAQSVRKAMSNELKDEVISDRGRFKFSPRAYLHYQHVATVVRAFASESASLRLPEYKTEKEVLGAVLTHSLVTGEPIDFVLPVCPDYGSGDQFYRSLGEGISPEARGAINFVRYADALLRPLGLLASYRILVANTEDDMPEVVNRIAGGPSQYQERCGVSCAMVQRQIADISNAHTYTFTQFLGSDFREKQYYYEKLLQQLSSSNSKFRKQVDQVGYTRVERHSQILGREEENFELTYRYMAQYASLGTILKSRSGLTVAVNYPTPNRKFFNAAQNVNSSIRLSERDSIVIPVLGSIVQR